AVPDLVAKLRHLGMPAAVVAEPERDTGALHRLDRLLRTRLRQRERLLAENVLALARCRDDLLDVQRMRRCENDRVDVGRIEHFLEARVELQLVLLRKGLHVVADRACRARDEPHAVALSRYGLDERSPPPAESYDSRVDHPNASSLGTWAAARVIPVIEIIEN